MALFKIILLFLIALVDSVVAFGPWLNVTNVIPAATGAVAVSSSPIVTTCVTVPGVSNSAIVYGTTVSIPVDYNHCDEANAACWEAGRRCGTIFHPALAPATSTVPSPMTTTIIVATTMSAPAQTTSADFAANQVADSAAFFAAFAAVLALEIV